MAQMTNTAQIVILGATVTQKDPRISKVARSLHDAGYAVVTAGIYAQNHELTEFPWTHVAVEPFEAYGDVPQNIEAGVVDRFFAGLLRIAAKAAKPFHAKSEDLLLKAATRSLRGQSVLSRARYYWQLRWGLLISPKNYPRAYWESNKVYGQFFDAIDKEINRCDLWIANDWDMLPIVQKLQKKYSGKIWYDSHEFATDEFSEQSEFRKWKQPLVRAVEADLITLCDRVSTVSPGLCDALQSLYGLEQTPHCVRNIPPYTKTPYRAANAPVKILYQGVVAQGRGLEALIKSAALWEGGNSLTIRGPESVPGYKNTLQDLIDAAIRERARSKLQVIEIELAPSVPFSELVTAAAEFDVGVMALPQNSVHQRFALPNKIFEYMMAGLAVLISDSQNMRDIIDRNRCGDVFENLEPESIAQTINALTPDRVNDFKRASLNAVETLNWETEFETLRASIDMVLG